MGGKSVSKNKGEDMNRQTYTILINDTAKQLVMPDPDSKKKRRALLKRLWDSIELLFPEENHEKRE